MKYKKYPYVSLLLKSIAVTTITIYISTVSILPISAEYENDTHVDIFEGSLYTDNRVLAQKLDEIFHVYPGQHKYLTTNANYPCTYSGVLCKTVSVNEGWYSGKQCWGLAQYVYWELFEAYMMSTSTYYPNTEQWKQTSKISMSGEKSFTYAVFLKHGIVTGSHIRNRYSSHGQIGGHSMIVLKYDKDGIYVFQCNESGNCDIHITYYTWKGFTDRWLVRVNGVIEGIFTPIDHHCSKGSEEDITDVATGISDEENTSSHSNSNEYINTTEGNFENDNRNISIQSKRTTLPYLNVAILLPLILSIVMALSVKLINLIKRKKYRGM